MVIVMASLFGTIILLPIYLQNVLHLEPARSPACCCCRAGS